MSECLAVELLLEADGVRHARGTANLAGARPPQLNHAFGRQGIVFMSLDLYTFMESLPDRQSWQSAIDQTGYDLKLDPDLDVAHKGGFSPCLIVGKTSGFELYATPTPEVLRSYPSLKSNVGERPHSLCFRWGGDLAECACVMGAALALVRAFGAVAYYPPDDMILDAAGLEKDLRECIANR